MSDQTLESPPSILPDQPPPSDSSSSSSSLSRNSSFSKLNAQAPEFVPKKSVTPPLPALADPRVIIVPPPPPPPVHLYHPPAVAAAQVNSPFPTVVPLPHLNPHHQPHHQPHHHNHHPHHHQDHHQQQQQHQHQHRNHHHHHHQKHHHDNQQKEEGQGSNNSNNNNNNNNNGGSKSNNNNNSNGLSDESTQKLINQVEYYFSDVNLATTDHLIKFIHKDPEGFVPIPVVASFKKIKALISSNSQLAAVLKNSTKLVISEDGKKVKRLHPLTVSDMEELQARIIVAENLPEDHCHQNLMKIFSTVGSVKSIRTCQPQPSNNGASSASRPSKTDNQHYSNKLHAFVEYDSIELAEKAITELNDEDNWRNGLRVRPLFKHGSKSGQPRNKKAANEGEVTCEEDASTSELKQNEKQSEDPSGQPGVNSHDHGDEQNLEKEGGQKKGRNRGRAKGRGRGQHNHNQNHNHQNNRGHHIGSPPVNNAINGEHPIGAKQPPPGPRMPDGTRGFSMGRGRPVAVNSTA